MHQPALKEFQTALAAGTRTLPAARRIPKARCRPQRRASELLFSLLLVLTVAMVTAAGGQAEDWPTYRHDNRRSGITPEAIRLPLAPAWTYASAAPPQTAWSGPAKWDSYANIRGLESMRNFDPAPFVIALKDSVYFGSSLDDAVHCLEAETGSEKWVFDTGGPARLPPTFHQHKVYFGSDDGYAYCLDAGQGHLVWKRKPAGSETLILNNGKLISHWPCRTGVLVQDDIAYFGASLLPWEDSYLCAVDAQTGAEDGPGRYRVIHPHLTMQGALLATDTRLYLPQGRQRPEMFDRATGRALGAFGESGDGGVFAVLTRAGEFVHGRGQNHRAGGELRGFDAITQDYFVTFAKATRIVVTEDMAYLNTGAELAGFDRGRYVELAKRQAQLRRQQKDIQDRLKKLGAQAQGPTGEQLRADLKPIESELNELVGKLAACYLWKTKADYPHDLILAGSTLFAGGDGRVAAFDTASGKERWSATVSGKAHGLAVAHGRLFVSTDRGMIHCFHSAPDR